MAEVESVREKKSHEVLNGSRSGEEMPQSATPKVTRKSSKKMRHDKATSPVRYFLSSGQTQSDKPDLSAECAQEVEAIAEAFRKQVSFFVVQEFNVHVENHNGAPLLRKDPVKDRSSP